MRRGMNVMHTGAADKIRRWTVVATVIEIGMRSAGFHVPTLLHNPTSHHSSDRAKNEQQHNTPAVLSIHPSRYPSWIGATIASRCRTTLCLRRHWLLLPFSIRSASHLSLRLVLLLIPLCHPFRTHHSRLLLAISCLINHCTSLST